MRMSGSNTHLRVLGRFELSIGQAPLSVGLSARRLLALLAVNGGPIARSRASGLLWPDTSPTRAAANLRQALWRLARCCPGAVGSSTGELDLTAVVRVDLHHALAIAQHLLDHSTRLTDRQLSEGLRANFYDELLPEWDDEWLVGERERFRQVRLHALEALGHRLAGAGWRGAAVQVALAAVRTDPFRESAREILIRTHLAENNYCEALRQYQAYRKTLRDEFGIEPSPELRRLLHANAKQRAM